MFRLIRDITAAASQHPNRWRLLALGCLYGSITAVLVLVVVMLLNLTRLTSDADLQRQLLIECTTPPGQREPPVTQPRKTDCFLRAQAQTQNAVANIGSITVIAASCGAAHPGDIPGTRLCVEAALQKENQ